MSFDLDFSDFGYLIVGLFVFMLLVFVVFGGVVGLFLSSLQGRLHSIQSKMDDEVIYNKIKSEVEILLLQGRNAEAKRLLEKHLEAHPDDKSAWILLDEIKE